MCVCVCVCVCACVRVCVNWIWDYITNNDWYAIKLNHIYLLYMYKQDLALNNLQWLICHKTKQNQDDGFYHTTMSFISLSDDIFKSKLTILFYAADKNS